MVVLVVKAGTAGGLRATVGTPGYMSHPETIENAGHRRVGVVVEGRCSTRLNSFANVEPRCYVSDWNSCLPHA